MNTARLDIFKNGVWQSLKLSKNESIRYNAIINDIGKFKTREISHSNTFSVDKISENIKILDLELFNPSRLAKALNTKYEARYYVDEILLRKGYVVINNMEDSIKLNFIDSSLSLTDIWGKYTFKELLNTSTITKPYDYEQAIGSIKKYDAPKDTSLQPTQPVGTRGYKLCAFPNSLNFIGEKFNRNKDDNRLSGALNPYQCRPTYNAKAILDLCVESFGYTSEFDESVNVEKLKKTFISSSNLKGDELENRGVISSDFTYHAEGARLYNPPSWVIPNPKFSEGVTIGAIYQDVFEYYLNDSEYNRTPTSNSISPSSIPNWVDPFNLYDGYDYVGDYRDRNTILVPSEGDSPNGKIQWICPQIRKNEVQYVLVYAIWKRSDGQAGIMTARMDTENDTSISTFDYWIDRKQFQSKKPSGAGDFIGVIATYRSRARVSSDPFSSEGDEYYIKVVNDIIVSKYWVFPPNSVQVKEETIPQSVVTFDDAGQYVSNRIDLTFGAPTCKIKDLISGIMQKECLLLDINKNNGIVKFFSYGTYVRKRIDGIYKDWSKYLLKYENIEYNTDYGNEYGKVNQLSLKNPYKGNVFTYNLNNSNEDLKYKEFAKNELSNFKDVTEVFKVQKLYGEYYLEMSAEGQSMFEQDGVLEEMRQVTYDTTTPITRYIKNVDKLVNVNFFNISDSVKDWYNVINNSVKVTASFLLPLQEIKDLDLSVPCYINDLNGFYIIEKVEEYIDAQTPVDVHLIKVETANSSIITEREIEISGEITDVEGTPTFSIKTTYSFIGIFPDNATIYYQQVDKDGNNIGSPEIDPLPLSVTGNVTKSINKETYKSYWQVYVLDNTGLKSNTISFEAGAYVNPDIKVNLKLTHLIESLNYVSVKSEWDCSGFSPTALRYQEAYSEGSSSDETTFDEDYESGSVVVTHPTGVINPNNFNRRTYKDVWVRHTVYEPNTLIKSNQVVMYVENKDGAIYNITGNPDYEPDCKLSWIQKPSAANDWVGIVRNSKKMYGNAYDEFNPFKVLVYDNDDKLTTKSLRLPKTGNDLIVQNWTFSLKGTHFEGKDNFKVKIFWSTDHSGWIENKEPEASIEISTIKNDISTHREVKLSTSFEFLNYLPNSASIYYQQTDSSGADIGNPIIDELTVSSTGNVDKEINKSTSSKTYWKVYIQDNLGKKSNEQSFEFSKFDIPPKKIDFTTSFVSDSIDKITVLNTWTIQGFIKDSLKIVTQSNTDVPNNDETTFPTTLSGGDDANIPEGTLQKETFRNSNLDYWKKVTVYDPDTGFKSESHTYYIENKNGTIYRKTGNPSYTPEFLISWIQRPSNSNGWVGIVRNDKNIVTDGTKGFRILAFDYDDNLTTKSINVGVDPIFQFNAGARIAFVLKGTHFEGKTNIKIKLWSKTTHSGWINYEL